jgi:hypothetical protein
LTRTEQSEPPHNIPVACLHAQARSYDAEKVLRQEKYLGIVKSLPQCGDEPAAFFRGEEFCLVRPIREDEKCDYSDPHSWDRFGDVHDLPTPQTERPSRPRSPVDIGAPTATLARAKNALAALHLHGSRAKCYTIFNINTRAASLPL